MRCASLRDGKCSALSTVFKLCHFNPRQRWPFQKAAFGSETNTSKALELVGLSRYYLFLVIAKALLRFSLQQLFDELATRTERQLKRMFKFAQGAAHLWDVHEIRMAKRERQLEVTPLRSLPLSRCRSSFNFGALRHLVFHRSAEDAERVIWKLRPNPPNRCSISCLVYFLIA